MSDFNQTRWADSTFAQEYLESADHYIPERPYFFQVLRSFYRTFVAKPPEAICVCDLGCGDGALTEQLLREDPSLHLTLVDGSEEMLAAAQKRLGARSPRRWVQGSFDALNRGALELGQFHLIVSGFAIHHLDRLDRQALFVALLRHLLPGGFFLNMDVALPTHGIYTEWRYSLWSDWIARHSLQLGLAEAFLNVPQKARANPDNKYSPLTEQLADLRQAGFREVECHYQHSVFAVYSGRTPET